MELIKKRRKVQWCIETNTITTFLFFFGLYYILISGSFLVSIVTCNYCILYVQYKKKWKFTKLKQDLLLAMCFRVALNTFSAYNTRIPVLANLSINQRISQIYPFLCSTISGNDFRYQKIYEIWVFVFYQLFCSTKLRWKAIKGLFKQM